jgi:hypothetical protein
MNLRLSLRDGSSFRVIMISGIEGVQAPKTSTQMDIQGEQKVRERGWRFSTVNFQLSQFRPKNIAFPTKLSISFRLTALPDLSNTVQKI